MTRERNPASHEISDFTFPQQLLLVVVIGLLALFTWRLTNLLILVFGAVVVAIALRTMASKLVTYLRVPTRWSVLATVLLVTLALVAGGWLMGDPLADQLLLLRQRIPNAAAAVMTWLNSHRLGLTVLELWENVKDIDVPWSKLAGFATGTLGALGSAGLVLVLGVYLAVDPQLYRTGVVRLIPVEQRGKVEEALRECGKGLSRWLLGQLISMLFVGATTALGLWVLGVPLALSIGLICGLLAFVPFFGAIAGGFLAVMLAFVEGPATALYVLLLFVFIQQIEGHLLVPLVQKWAVELPPALGIAATIAFGILFGLVGALFATPLVVVAMILVRKLYIEDYLERTEDG